MSLAELMPMQAFNNDPELKKKVIEEVKRHRMADAIVQGYYGEDCRNAVEFSGCAVGCTLHSLEKLKVIEAGQSYGSHKLYNAIGLPKSIAILEDDIFERLPTTRSKEWPLRFLESVPVGADTQQVPYLLGLSLLEDVLKDSDLTEKSLEDLNKIKGFYTKLASHDKQDYRDEIDFFANVEYRSYSAIQNESERLVQSLKYAYEGFSAVKQDFLDKPYNIEDFCAYHMNKVEETDCTYDGLYEAVVDKLCEILAASKPSPYYVSS